MENAEYRFIYENKATVEALDKDEAAMLEKAALKGKALCKKISKACDGYNSLTVISANTTIITETLCDLRKANENNGSVDLEWARGFLDNLKSSVLDCLVKDGWK